MQIVCTGPGLHPVVVLGYQGYIRLLERRLAAASGEQKHMRGVVHQTHVPPKNRPQKPPTPELNRGVLGSFGGKNTPRESTAGLFS